MDYSNVTENYAVAPQISATDVADLVAAGFAAIICNRPDNEEPSQPTASEVRAACEQAGIEFHHIPFAGAPPTTELITAHRDVIQNSAGPVLGYCRSGQRSFLIWQAGNQPEQNSV